MHTSEPKATKSLLKEREKSGERGKREEKSRRKRGARRERGFNELGHIHGRIE